MFSFLVDLWPLQTRERLPLPPGGTRVHQAPKPGKESDLTYPLHNYSYPVLWEVILSKALSAYYVQDHITCYTAIWHMYRSSS